MLFLMKLCFFSSVYQLLMASQLVTYYIYDNSCSIGWKLMGRFMKWRELVRCCKKSSLPHLINLNSLSGYYRSIMRLDWRWFRGLILKLGRSSPSFFFRMWYNWSFWIDDTFSLKPCLKYFRKRCFDHLRDFTPAYMWMNFPYQWSLFMNVIPANENLKILSILLFGSNRSEFISTCIFYFPSLWPKLKKWAGNFLDFFKNLACSNISFQNFLKLPRIHIGYLFS